MSNPAMKLLVPRAGPVAATEKPDWKVTSKHVVRGMIRVPHGIILPSGIELQEGFMLLRRARGAHKGRLEPPGGKVEEDETLEIALVREIHEETGLNAVVSYHVAGYSYISKNNGPSVVDFFRVEILQPAMFAMHEGHNLIVSANAANISLYVPHMDDKSLLALKMELRIS